MGCCLVDAVVVGVAVGMLAVVAGTAVAYAALVVFVVASVACWEPAGSGAFVAGTVGAALERDAVDTSAGWSEMVHAAVVGCGGGWDAVECCSQAPPCRIAVAIGPFGPA